MLRLFGTVGLLVVVSAGLAVGTGSLFFRLLTLVIGFGLVGLYLWLQRSLPPRSGALRLRGLREMAEVFRDDRGVPHIYARNLHDLYFAQGYITAQDRLWAMDMHRRAASGRLAELFGAGALELDKHFRTLGMHRAAEQSLEAYTPAVRAYLQAFADGVNARIAENRLPPEFAILRYRPEQWSPLDSLLLAKYMAHELTGNWAGDLFRGELVRTVGAEKAAELFWETPDLAALSELEEIPLPDLSRLFELAAATVNEAIGSSGWVVAGSRTRSGAPALANDLHARVRNPCLWYQTHLTGPDGLDVTGISFPGIPGVLLGQNRDIAWGTSNVRADVQDLYVEMFHPDRPQEYAVQGAWDKAAVHAETIRVRGVAEPVKHEVTVTRHGPVIARSGTTALSLQWTSLGATKELEAFLLINSAGTWSEFRQALESYDGPPQNFLFAGRDGTIGWRMAGTVPLRAGGGGQAPFPGWKGDGEWMGFLPFEEMPESVNPSEGYLVSADSEVAPGLVSDRLGAMWAPPYRALRIRERLHGAADLTAAKLLELQTDRVNLHARSMLQILLHAVQEGLRQGVQPETLNETERSALLLLSGWDCTEEIWAPAPVLWHQWYQFLMEGIFRPQMGLALFDPFLSCGMATPITDRMVRHVAEGGDSAWLAREGEEGLNRLALRAFRRSVALVAAKQGPRPEKWRWDREHSLGFPHPLGTRSKMLRWVLDLGPGAVGGSGQTVWSNSYYPLHPFAVNVHAPWRQVVDFGSAEGQMDICAPGQSGHALSPHYGDQLSPWLRGEAYRRQLHHDAIRSLPRLVLWPDSQS